MKELDWANLPFGYMKTDYNVRIYYRNEQWGELEVCSEETIPMHMAATCLHYGQEAFEGLKAFRGKDGKVRIFRLEENAARLQSTCPVSYTHLRTPNPCVMCNPLFKFRILAEWADKLGCAYIATGHYTRLEERNGKVYIIAGDDDKKDQSYFLWRLGQELLKRCIFPLGRCV